MSFFGGGKSGPSAAELARQNALREQEELRTLELAEETAEEKLRRIRGERGRKALFSGGAGGFNIGFGGGPGVGGGAGPNGAAGPGSNAGNPAGSAVGPAGNGF